MQTGFHTDPASSAFVRVDDGKARDLTTFNSFMAGRTLKAQRAEETKLVGEEGQNRARPVLAVSA